MPSIDLTHFGFTPTEGLVYEVLLTGGPGTGYAIARAAGLARANAYSALEGLVSKGAARVDDGRPRRYRPEAPAALIARIATDHGQALERLSRELDAASVPDTETLVEVTPAGRCSSSSRTMSPAPPSRSASSHRLTRTRSLHRRSGAHTRRGCRST